MLRSERDLILRVARRYMPRKEFAAYAFCKMKLDPAYRTVRDRLRDSTLAMLDIGCGIGTLGAYLRESGCTFPITGIDISDEKIATAREVARKHYPNIEFLAGDGSRLDMFRGNVVLLDVIHYFEDDQQRGFLERIADMIPPDGQVLIRIAVRDRSLRYVATLLEEIFIKATRWIEGGALNFPTADEVAEPFRRRGFSERIGPLWGKTPFNSYFFEFKR